MESHMDQSVLQIIQQHIYEFLRILKNKIGFGKVTLCFPK